MHVELSHYGQHYGFCILDIKVFHQKFEYLKLFYYFRSKYPNNPVWTRQDFYSEIKVCIFYPIYAFNGRTKSFLFLSDNVSSQPLDYLCNKLKYRNLNGVILLEENVEMYHSCIMFSVSGCKRLRIYTLYLFSNVLTFAP